MAREFATAAWNPPNPTAWRAERRKTWPAFNTGNRRKVDPASIAGRELLMGICEASEMKEGFRDKSLMLAKDPLGLDRIDFLRPTVDNGRRYRVIGTPYVEDKFGMDTRVLRLSLRFKMAVLAWREIFEGKIARVQPDDALNNYLKIDQGL
ncbi:hypothetical protein KM043_009872 [Ampulex compressa]|nr:hypothetical protein KM043_009872 [Ampulex compressa]